MIIIMPSESIVKVYNMINQLKLLLTLIPCVYYAVFATCRFQHFIHLQWIQMRFENVRERSHITSSDFGTF